jgi:biopolymer transport protein ExbB
MWEQMGFLAKLVVVTLAIMSMFSLGVIVERFYTFLRAQRQSVSFIVSLRGFIQGHRLADAVGVAMGSRHSPLAKVIGAGITEYVSGMTALQAKGPADVGEFDLVDAVNRQLERVKEREVADLRKGLGTLATVGSSAPFVGLFGTVVGIINAFQAMAATNSGGLGSVSAGIAEALVTTAFGLLVAIPAVWMFNYFSNRVDGFVVDINDVSSELVDYILKEGRAPGHK